MALKAAKVKVFIDNRANSNSDTVVGSLAYNIANWLESTVSSGASIAISSFVMPGGSVGAIVITST